MKYTVGKIYCLRKENLSKCVLSYKELNKNTKSIKQQVKDKALNENKMKGEISELVKQIKFNTSTFIALINKLETRRDQKERRILNFSPGGKVRMINSIKKYKHRDLKIIEDRQFRGQR